LDSQTVGQPRTVEWLRQLEWQDAIKEEILEADDANA
jgi:hypothetical protein